MSGPNFEAAHQAFRKLDAAVSSMAAALESVPVDCCQRPTQPCYCAQQSSQSQVETLKEDVRSLQRALEAALGPSRRSTCGSSQHAPNPDCVGCVMSSVLRCLQQTLSSPGEPDKAPAAPAAPNPAPHPTPPSVMLVGPMARFADMKRAAERARSSGLACHTVLSVADALRACAEGFEGAVVLEPDAEVRPHSLLDLLEGFGGRAGRPVRVVGAHKVLGDVLLGAGVPPAADNWDAVSFAWLKDASGAAARPHQAASRGVTGAVPPSLHRVSSSKSDESEVVPVEPTSSAFAVARAAACSGPDESVADDEGEGSVGSAGSVGSGECPAANHQPVAIRRSKRACAYCHEKKVHCSGGRPCQRCEGAGRECVEYRSKPRVGKRPASFSSGPASHPLPPYQAPPEYSGEPLHKRPTPASPAEPGSFVSSMSPRSSSQLALAAFMSGMRGQAHHESSAPKAGGGAYEALSVLSHAASLANTWRPRGGEEMGAHKPWVDPRAPPVMHPHGLPPQATLRMPAPQGGGFMSQQPQAPGQHHHHQHHHTMGQREAGFHSPFSGAMGLLSQGFHRPAAHSYTLGV